jgi:hypothetical protein
MNWGVRTPAADRIAATRRGWRQAVLRRLIRLALVLIATTSAQLAQAGGEELRACDFEVKARCASGDASVALADGVVKKLEINVFWCGLPGKPGYTCTLDALRGDKDSTWSDDGGATLIDIAAAGRPDQHDRVKVTVGRYVSIDLSGTQSSANCGAGAALPRALVIPAKNGKCRVWLDEP